MIQLTIKDLWGRKRRLAGSFIAVFLGVAFLTGTLVLGDTLSTSIDGFFTRSYKGTDVTVRNATSVTDEPGTSRGMIDASLEQRVRTVSGVAKAEPVVSGNGQLLGKDGKIIENRGPRRAENWISDPKLTAYRLAKGREPRTDTEVVIDRRSAKSGKLKVGDRTGVLVPKRLDVTVVGIATFGDDDSLGETSYTAFTLAGAREHVAQDPRKISGVAVRAGPGVSPDALAQRIGSTLPQGVEAITGDALAKEGQDQVGKAFADRFRVILGIFGGVALLVAAFSIHNTFAITVAQRTRESALLRALGASRGQVIALVSAEALMIGVVATLAGLAGGVGIAALLKLLFSGFGMGLPAAGLVFTAQSVLIAAPVGLVVTLLAALTPALRASRTAPVTAMAESAAERRGPGRGRIAAGVVIGALAVAGVVQGALAESLMTATVGALLSVAAMVVLGPVAARPAAAVMGSPAARLRGVPGALARGNAARSPRRTAGAATALMIGVGVVTLMTVFAGSFKAGLEDDVAGSFNGDLVMGGGFNESGGFSTQMATEIGALPQVRAAAGLGLGNARVDGSKTQVGIADGAQLDKVLGLDVTSGTLGSGLAVSKKAADDHSWKVGSTATVTYADGAKEAMPVGAIYRNADIAKDYVVPRSAWSQHDRQNLDMTVFVHLKPGVPEADGKSAIGAIAKANGSPEVQNRDEFVASQTEALDTFLAIVYVMLALAIIIALMGIANTLALSVHERTRELGLLRAVGGTRAQVRSMVRWESVIVALFGTIGGMGLGIFLGWALARAGGNPFAAPAMLMAVIAVVGAIAGVLAAIRPARRAAKLDVLTAIATS